MIEPGTRLGPYEVTAKLGEGGMGEVWRATDSRLKREVALKVLPAAFTADPERLARFEREAQLLAQLHHPHIASIFGLEEAEGVRALVMELVEGLTLEERLAHGALPVEECVAIARQIAEALEEAHEKGIVHRDLKPANVKITPDGKVKVLDFGLAKAMDATASGVATSPTDIAHSPTLMHSPTLTALHGTQLGVILGTAAYMAPEQARGAAVDKRADVWAFGVILHEMLTGRRLFAGDTVSDVLAAVLRAEVDFAALPADTPPALRRLLRRCLERNPKQRLRDIGEARVALDPGAASLSEQVATPPAPAGLDAVRWLPWALVVLLLAGFAWAWRHAAGARSAATARTPVLALRLPAGKALAIDERGIYGQTGVLAIAPDGSRVAFVEGSVGKGPLYVRDLDQPEYRLLEGTDGASSPFFSPDGRWIAYFAPGKLRKVSVDGGQPIDLASSNLDRGGVWCPDGSIVYAPEATAGLMRLPPGGGAPQPLTHVDVARGERTHRWPAVLPGGREVAFTIGTLGQPGDYDDSAVDAVDLASGRRRPLLRGGSMVRFTPDGVALLARGGEVLALPLDRAHGQRADDARVVLQKVAGVAASGVSYFDVAHDGTLVYAEVDPHSEERDLAWFSPTGEARPLPLPKGNYRLMRIAPDGKHVAIAIGSGQGRDGDIWLLDLGTSATTKLSFDGRSWYPAWSRDGKSITYVTIFASGAEEFRRRPVDGSQEAVTVAHFDQGSARAPVAWMADGSLLFGEDDGARGAGNFYYLPPGGGTPRPFAVTPAVEMSAAASPDGRYVAYVADSTGRPDLFVQPFPPTGAKWLVAEGGGSPLWSADGRELYFVAGRELRAVPVTTGAGFAIGAARKLFDFPISTMISDDTYTSFDVGPDGSFLLPRNSATGAMNDHLIVVLDWFARLKGVS